MARLKEAVRRQLTLVRPGRATYELPLLESEWQHCRRLCTLDDAETRALAHLYGKRLDPQSATRIVRARRWPKGFLRHNISVLERAVAGNVAIEELIWEQGRSASLYEEYSSGLIAQLSPHAREAAISLDKIASEMARIPEVCEVDSASRRLPEGITEEEWSIYVGLKKNAPHLFAPKGGGKVLPPLPEWPKIPRSDPAKFAVQPSYVTDPIHGNISQPGGSHVLANRLLDVVHDKEVSLITFTAGCKPGVFPSAGKKDLRLKRLSQKHSMMYPLQGSRA